MADALLKVMDLSRQFGAVQAVRGISFEIAPGETFGIVGESGSGKSTAARLVLRLIEPSAGSVHFRGRDLKSLSGNELRDERRHMQMVFQDPMGSLNPRMTIGELIAEPMLVHDIGTPSARHERALALLDEVGLPTSAMQRYAHEFSGGQRQRIAIARALATEPALIVADEPVSALDVSVQAQVLNLLLDLQEKHKTTLLFISHDLRVIEFMCTRVAVMYLGEIVESGPRSEVFAAPRHPYTQALFDSMPGRGEAARHLQGEIPSPSAVPSGCAFRTRCPQAHERCVTEHPSLRQVGHAHHAACHLLESPSA